MAVENAFLNAAGNTALESTTSALPAVFDPNTIMSTDAIMQSAMPTLTTGLGEATTDAGLDAILGNAGASTFGDISADAINSNSDSIFGQVAGGVGNSYGDAAAGPGFMSQLGDVLGSKSFENSVNLGGKIFSGINSYETRKDAKEYQDKTLAMSQDAYDRNVEADEKRQALNF